MQKNFHLSAALSGSLAAVAMSALLSGGGPVKGSYPPAIKTLFDQRCISCHNSKVKQGSLDLSTPDGLLQGGDRGAAIEPGKAKVSLLFQMVAHKREPVMPYKAAKIPDAEVAALENWIDSGAKLDAPLQSRADGDVFTTHIRQVLETKCLVCHGGKFKQAGLSLVSRETLLRGSDNGPVVDTANPKASLLMKKIRHEHEPGMPYNAAKLSPVIIEQMEQWIKQGAHYDKPLDPGAVDTTTSVGPKHWAYEKPVAGAVPAVKQPKWPRNPIDHFLLSRMEQKGLTPVEEADKRTLLRRAYLDVTGLPPTPEEVNTFLADGAPDAYERVVDRLLASPHYGERWGRHWMDIWRYSDVYGASITDPRNSQPFMWRWRDWIIASLNADKGYDRMVQEMLAADELAPGDPKVLAATGYLARSWVRYSRNFWLQDTVEATAAGFLGVTLRCARCHDHKFDPIAQEEYYRFRAFFEPHDVRTDRLPGKPDLSKDGLTRIFDSEPRLAPKDPNEPTNDLSPPIFGETFRFVRGDEKVPDKEMKITPGTPAALHGAELKIEPIKLPLNAYFPDLNDAIRRDLLVEARAEIDRSERALKDAKAKAVEARRAAASSTIGKPTPTDGFDDPRAVLKRHCFACHHNNVSMSNLKLGTLDGLLEGGRLYGPAIIPGHSAKSPAIQTMRGQLTPSMPPEKEKLSEKDIAIVAKWIDSLPEEDPGVVVERAESRLAIAERELLAAKADIPAIEARFAADFAKYADPPDPKADDLAKVAKSLERDAGLLHAGARLVRAERKVLEALRARDAKLDYRTTESQDTKIETAQKELAAARQGLSAGATTYTSVGKLYPKTSTGRRLALARWIGNKENPLTARVAVNHIWLRHFGKPLTRTVSNFGRSGTPPTHPELLDWMAVKFMENGWSMKWLHRTILTSSAYRMRSTYAGSASQSNVAIDPENRLLWKMNPRRMEAEIVRDSLLAVAGKLDRTIGGPEIDEQKEDVVPRRTVYFRYTPVAQIGMLRIFDGADPNSCFERTESIMPQQALALANSKMALTLAAELTGRLSPRAATGDAFMNEAFEIILGRPPLEKERTLAVEFLERQGLLLKDVARLTPFHSKEERESIADPALRARQNLVHVLMNHTDFVTIR